MKRFLAILLAALAVLPVASAPAAEEEPDHSYILGQATRAKALTAGPEGDLWFVAARWESEDLILGKVTPTGAVTELETGVKGVPKAQYEPNGTILDGPEGDLWFGEARGVGRSTTSGSVRSFPLPGGSSAPTAMALGPEGDIWFTERAASKIGRIAADGTISEFPLPPGREPSGIAAGPEGDLWFTEHGADEIGRIDPAGHVTEYPVPGEDLELDSIARGPDGNLWFAEAKTPRVGRITPSGVVTQFRVPTSVGTRGIVAGPGDRLFFISGPEIGAIGPGGAISWPACLGPECHIAIEAIAQGPDGRLWAASGEASCLGLCGGGTELGFAFEPGSITPYTLPPLKLGLGPRLTELRGGRTTLLVACGSSTECRGKVRLGWYVYRHHRQRFVTLSHATYDLAAGQSKRLSLGFRSKTARSLAHSYEPRVHLLAFAEDEDGVKARRGFLLQTR